MLSASIRGSSFVQCNAASGGALVFDTNGNTTINFYNNHFVKNSADVGEILSITSKQNQIITGNATIRSVLTVADAELHFTNVRF